MKITGRITLLVLFSLVSIKSMASGLPSIPKSSPNAVTSNNPRLLPKVERPALCRDVVEIDVDSLKFTQVDIGARIDVNISKDRQHELDVQATRWVEALIKAAADPEGELEQLKAELIANNLAQVSQYIHDLITGNILLEKQDKDFSGQTLQDIEESNINTRNIVNGVLEGQAVLGRASDEIGKAATAFTQIQNEIQPPTGLAGLRYKFGRKFNALHDRLASGGKVARFVSKAVPSMRTTEEYKTYADRILAVVNGMTANIAIAQDTENFLRDFSKRIQNETRALPEQIYFEREIARGVEAWVQKYENDERPNVQVLRHNVQQGVRPMLEGQLATDQELFETLNLLMGTLASARQSASETRMQTTAFQRSFLVQGVTALTASSALDTTTKIGQSNKLAKNAANASAAFAVHQARQAQDQIIENMQLMGNFREAAMKLAKKAQENHITFEANRISVINALANSNDSYMQMGAAGVVDMKQDSKRSKPVAQPTQRLASPTGIPSVPPIVGREKSGAPISRDGQE